LAHIPQAARMAELPLPEQYAAAELFRGTMVRHSLVAYRNDSPAGSAPVSFAGDGWPGYVPVRMSETICVQKRLPRGAAAVLINQSHTCRDLVMPIDSAEKGLLDAMDGERCIGEIVDEAFGSSGQDLLEAARAFFERLWWYDQVVLDVSGPAWAGGTPAGQKGERP
jgi:hypothetical protein